MRALQELQKKQREMPLGPAGDRIAPLFAQMPATGIEKLDGQRANGSIVVGEVNSRLPNAKTFHYPDGSHATMVFTGLVDFYWATSEILNSSMTTHSETETREGRSMNEAVDDLKELFLRWTPQGITENSEPMEPRTSAGWPYTKVLADAALSFVLGHEMGHVMYYKRPKGWANDSGLTKKQELRSDALGTDFALDPTRGLGDRRFQIAGAVISLRMLAVLAKLGHPFKGDHPDPAERLQAVIQRAKEVCASERDFWSASPIAFAFDEMLETAVSQATGGTDRLPLTFDRTFSRLSSVLEEVAKRHQQPSFFVAIMQNDFNDATPELIAEIAKHAGAMFPQTPLLTGNNREDELWAVKGNILRATYRAWPEHVRSVFEHALGTSNN